MLAHVHLHRKGILILDHHPVGADIDLAGFRVFGDHPAAGPDVRSAIEIVPFGYGKFIQIDLIIDHLVFKHRTAFDLLDRHRFVSSQFLPPCVQIIDALELGINAHRRAGAPARAENIGNDAKARWEFFEIVKQQRRPFFLRRPLGERAHFQVKIYALESSQFAHLLQQLHVSSHVGHIGHGVLLICGHTIVVIRASQMNAKIRV